MNERQELIDAITPATSAMTHDEVHALERTKRLQSADVTEGDLAPDFDLPIYDFSDGTRRESEDTFHLQAVAANTPVALIFGSYT